MKRDMSIDVARGIAILLVAFFHVTIGMVDGGFIENSIYLEFFTSIAYSFHVQIFFIFSGYFLYERISSWRDFLPRFLDLYWPYLIWSFFSIALILVLGIGGGGWSYDDLILIPIAPVQHYWFLLFLIFSMSIFLIRNINIGIAISLFIFSNVILEIFDVNIGIRDLNLKSLTYWPIFFLVGAILRQRNKDIRYPSIPIALSLAGVAGLGVICVTAGVAPRDGLLLPLSLLGCHALISISDRLKFAWLAVLGELSIVIYLAHVMAGAAVRAALYRLFPDIPATLAVAVIFAASIGVPLVLYAASRRLGVDWLLGFSSITQHFAQRKKHLTAKSGKS